MFVETKREGEAPQIKPTYDGFIEWLKKQDPNERYDFTNPTKCPVGRYVISLGLGILIPQQYGGTEDVRRFIGKDPCYLAMEPQTYGAALKRLSLSYDDLWEKAGPEFAHLTAQMIEDMKGVLPATGTFGMAMKPLVVPASVNFNYEDIAVA